MRLSPRHGWSFPPLNIFSQFWGMNVKRTVREVAAKGALNLGTIMVIRQRPIH